MIDTLPRVVWYGETDWLSVPGLYLVKNADRTDRERIQRHVRKAGLRARTSWDNGRLTVEIDAA